VQATEFSQSPCNLEHLSAMYWSNHATAYTLHGHVFHKFKMQPERHVQQQTC